MKYKDRKIIGITGGIGSGKTMVLKLLHDRYDAQVIEADKVGHELQEPGEAVYMRIVDIFGKDVLQKPYIAGTSPIDRKKLGAIVFADDIQLAVLNSITHPAIHRRISDMIAESDRNLIFIEAAVLTESPLVELIDELWLIYADMTVRLERLQQHRGILPEKALRIMTNQPADEYLRKRCDVVIDNSHTLENTLEQIDNEISRIQEEHYE